MRVAVFAGRFPEVSETFVLDHVTSLLERQIDVQVHGVQKGRVIAHAAFEKYGLQQRTHLPPELPRRTLARALALMRMRGPHAGLDAAALLRGLATGEARMPAWHGYLLSRTLLQRPLRADLVHAHFATIGNVVAGLVRRGLVQKPLVASVHGHDVTSAVQRGSRPYDTLFATASRVLVTTGFMADQAACAGCPEKKLVRLPLGIHLDQFPFAERRLLPGQLPTIITVGRLVEKKGHHVALAALARLAASGVKFRYLVVGWGAQEDLLRRMVADLGLGKQVEFMGAQPREVVRRLLEESHLFLLPGVRGRDGDQEGQGIVLQEAQACGLPVVASRIGGIPESVHEGHSAVLVEPGDDKDLATALTALLMAPLRWPIMGRAGRAFVEARFDHRQTTERLLDIYADVLGEHSKQPSENL